RGIGIALATAVLAKQQNRPPRGPSSRPDPCVLLCQMAAYWGWRLRHSSWWCLGFIRSCARPKPRIYQGDPRSAGKIVSSAEPSAKVVRKGTAAKPTELGKRVKLQEEAESRIIIILPRGSCVGCLEMCEENALPQLCEKSRHHPWGLIVPATFLHELGSSK